MRKPTQKKWPIVLVAAAFIAAAAAAPALAEQKFEEKFAKTVPLSKTGTLYLANVSGDIEVLTWKDAQVKIEAVKISKADSLEKAKENAAKVTIEVTGEAERVSVETKYPKRQGGFWGGDSISVSVDYKVWVPEQAAVEIKSVSGDVQIAPIGGKARIDSVSGNVGLRGAAGADVKLVSGDLKMENIAGDAFIKAVSGDIDVTRIKGSIEADAVSGDIVLEDVSEAQTVDIKTVSGNVTYYRPAPGGRPLRAQDPQRRRPDDHPRRLRLRPRGQHVQRRHRQRIRDHRQRQDLAEGDPRDGRQGRGHAHPQELQRQRRPEEEVNRGHNTIFRISGGGGRAAPFFV